MPTSYHRSRLRTVGNAHPTSAILDSTDGEFQVFIDPSDLETINSCFLGDSASMTEDRRSHAEEKHRRKRRHDQYLAVAYHIEIPIVL